MRAAPISLLCFWRSPIYRLSMLLTAQRGKKKSSRCDQKKLNMLATHVGFSSTRAVIHMLIKYKHLSRTSIRGTQEKSANCQVIVQASCVLLGTAGSRTGLAQAWPHHPWPCFSGLLNCPATGHDQLLDSNLDHWHWELSKHYQHLHSTCSAHSRLQQYKWLMKYESRGLDQRFHPHSQFRPLPRDILQVQVLRLQCPLECLQH